jgi:hypothetical protein
MTGPYCRDRGVNAKSYDLSHKAMSAMTSEMVPDRDSIGVSVMS